MYSSFGNRPGLAPLEEYRSRKQNISSIPVLGSKAFVHVPIQKRKDKLSSRSMQGIVVGYSPENIYCVLIRLDGRRNVIVSKDVTFNEKPLDAQSNF